MIVVLSLLLLISLMTSAIVTISLTSAAQTSAFTEFEKSMLLAEGASARIYWLILNDRILHPDRKLDTTADSGKNNGKETEKAEYLADGTEHHMNYYGCNLNFTISDMISGFDVSGFAPENNLQDLGKKDNSAIEEIDPEFEIFKNRLMDYIDTDSLVRLYGMEKDDYRSLCFYNLPRNNKMQYREEILFIPDAKKFFNVDSYGRLSSIKVIVPQRIGGGNQQLNIFAVDISIIKAKIKCSNEEAELIQKALELWKKDQTPLSDSLPLELITKLKQYFTFEESGLYNITIRVASNDANKGRMLSISMKITQSIAPEGITYFEWTYY